MGIVDFGKAASFHLKERLIPQRVVFHHVPKCGGTSVGRALRRRYLLSQATVKPEESFRAFEAFTGRSDRERMLRDVLDLREQMMLYLLFDDVRCVSLHVRFSARAHQLFKERYKFVTILREPVQRFISHYYWSHEKPGAHARIEEDFEAFLGTDRARRLGASYPEFYSGLPATSDFSSDEAVAHAIRNLEKFDVVGRLDDLTGFETAIRKALRVRVKIGHENRMKKSQAPARAKIGPELLQRVEEVCRPDITVWKWLVDRR